MTRARFGWLAVVAVSVLVSGLRFVLLRSGPELDTDAYGHAVIGRALLSSPMDLRQHWVWLPLWHFVFAGAAHLGRGIDDVRTLSLGCSALTPLLVTAAGRADQGHHRRPTQQAVPFLAGIFSALWPLGLDHGQSAEPEPLFACLLLAATLGWETRHVIIGGAVWGMAIFLRFEAWALLPAGVALVLFSRRQSPHLARRVLRGAAFVLIPALAALGYCILHRLQTGEWLQFVRINREFVSEALRVAPPPRFHDPVQRALLYPVLLPWRSLGVVALFLAVGVVPFARTAPPSFRAFGACLLAFVTYGWIRGLHLGLDRHFFAVMPFASYALAQGANQVAAVAGRRLGPFAAPIPGAAAVTVFASCTWPAFRAAHAAHSAAFLDERHAARLLATAEATEPSPVFCDLPRVEILSGLPEGLFRRWNVGDLLPAHLDGEATAAGGRVFVVSAPSRTAALAASGRGAWLFASTDVALVSWPAPGRDSSR